VRHRADGRGDVRPSPQDKSAFLFSAMRQFAIEFELREFRVRDRRLADAEKTKIAKNVTARFATLKPSFEWP
jgi:hypothetical protein